MPNTKQNWIKVERGVPDALGFLRVAGDVIGKRLTDKQLTAEAPV